MSGTDNTKNNTSSPVYNMHEPKIGHEFLKILRENAFNGMDIGDVIDHITRVVKITKWIKIPDINKNQLRIYVFSKSLSNDAEKWWNDEIKGTTLALDTKSVTPPFLCIAAEANMRIQLWPMTDSDDVRMETNRHAKITKFKIGDEFLKILQDSAFNGMDGGDVTDHIAKIDRNTKNGLWEFYVNERTNEKIGDVDEYNESHKMTCSDAFYKPYLDAQEANDIYEVIDREYSPIPIPALHDINNPEELCRTEEFTIIRHSIGNDEEFITVSPSKISTIERTLGSMSCIYHEIFNRKDHGWEVTQTK
ncbi:hypothetical protein Tco_1210955 [Tanacetum coccineum]